MHPNKVLARFKGMQFNKNEGRLVAASFFMNMGVDSGYFVGFVGYAAYEFGGNVTIIATAMAILSVFYMFGNLLGGILVDKIGPRRATFLSSMAMVLVCVAALFINKQLIVFLILSAIFGLVGAVLQSSIGSFAPYLSREREGIRRLNSYITTGMFVSTIFGGSLSAILADSFAHQSVFLMVAATVIISGLLALTVREHYSPHDLPEGEAERETEGETEGEYVQIVDGDTAVSPPEKMGAWHTALEGWNLIRKSTSLRFYLMIAIVMWFSFGAFDALESLYYRDILLMPVSWMGWVNAIIGVGLAIGAFGLSKIPGKYITAFLLVVLLAAEGATTVLYVATRSALWSAVGAFLLGIAFGIVDPLLRTLIQVDSPLKVAGRVMGTVDMIRKGFTFIPLAIAPALYGLFGIQPVLIGAGTITILMAFALYPASRRLDARKATTRHIDHVNPFIDD